MEDNEQLSPNSVFNGYASILVAVVLLLLSVLASSLAFTLLKAYDFPAVVVASLLQQVGFLMIVPIVYSFGKGHDPDVFAFRLPSLKSGLIWSVVFIAYIGLMTATFILFNRTDGTEAMLKLWKQCTGVFQILFVINVVLLAPLGEEIFFRGYLFGKLKTLSGGPVGGILISTLVWTLLHAQYKWPELVALFVMGCILCFIRHKTGSLWLPIILHAVNNCLGMLGLMVES